MTEEELKSVSKLETKVATLEARLAAVEATAAQASRLATEDRALLWKEIDRVNDEFRKVYRSIEASHLSLKERIGAPVATDVDTARPTSESVSASAVVLVPALSSLRLPCCGSWPSEPHASSCPSRFEL